MTARDDYPWLAAHALGDTQTYMREAAAALDELDRLRAATGAALRSIDDPVTRAQIAQQTLGKAWPAAITDPSPTRR